jgi:hypothetical protein
MSDSAQFYFSLLLLPIFGKNSGHACQHKDKIKSEIISKTLLILNFLKESLQVLQGPFRDYPSATTLQGLPFRDYPSGTTLKGLPLRDYPSGTTLKGLPFRDYP